MSSEYIKISEIAKTFNLPPRTVQNYCKVGKLEAIKIGKYWLVKREVFERIKNEGLK